MIGPGRVGQWRVDNNDEFERSPNRYIQLIYPRYNRFLMPVLIGFNPFVTACAFEQNTIMWSAVAVLAVLVDYALYEVLENNIRVARALITRALRRRVSNV